MNFKEKIASYKFGFLLSSDLPGIALTAIEEGYDSVNLAVLAGMSQHSNTFELEYYFKDGLKDIGINLPEDKDAFNIILRYYLLGIKSKEIDFHEGLDFIYKKLVLGHEHIFGDAGEVAYEPCGLSKLVGTYIRYTDVEDDIKGGLLYKPGVNDIALKDDYRKSIIDELDVCLRKMDEGTLN